MKKVRLACIGAGSWGIHHVRQFAALEQSDLTACCDQNAARRALVSAQYPYLAVIDRPDRLMTDTSIQALVIATNAQNHYALAKQALSAGKDVFVEKPLTLSVQEASELVTLAEQKNRILMVGHLMLYHPAVTALKACIDRGGIG